MRHLAWLTRIRIAIALAALVAGYLIFSAASDVLLSRRLNEDQEGLQRDIAELQQDKTELEQLRDYLQTDQYVEAVARNLLGLVRPGETLVDVVSTAPVTPAPDDPEGEAGQSWWERLYGP